jgi:hypothetical protein
MKRELTRLEQEIENRISQLPLGMSNTDKYISSYVEGSFEKLLNDYGVDRRLKDEVIFDVIHHQGTGVLNLNIGNYFTALLIYDICCPAVVSNENIKIQLNGDEYVEWVNGSFHHRFFEDKAIWDIEGQWLHRNIAHKGESHIVTVTKGRQSNILKRYKDKLLSWI